MPAPATWACPAPAALWPPLTVYPACGAEAAPQHVVLPKYLRPGRKSNRKQEPAGSFVALFSSRYCQQRRSNPFISAGSGATHQRGTGLCSCGSIYSLGPCRVIWYHLTESLYGFQEYIHGLTSRTHSSKDQVSLIVSRHL